MEGLHGYEQPAVSVGDADELSEMIGGIFAIAMKPKEKRPRRRIGWRAHQVTAVHAGFDNVRVRLSAREFRVRMQAHASQS